MDTAPDETADMNEHTMATGMGQGAWIAGWPRDPMQDPRVRAFLADWLDGYDYIAEYNGQPTERARGGDDQ